MNDRATEFHRFSRLVPTLAALVALLPLAPLAGCAGPKPTPTILSPQSRVELRLPAGLLPEPRSGRITIWFIRDDAEDLDGDDPARGPFLDDPQPILGASVQNLTGGQSITLPGPQVPVFDLYGHLDPGSYLVRAVFDWQFVSSDWFREPGNLYSEIKTILIPEPDSTPLRAVIDLDQIVAPAERPETPGVDWVSTPSRLLSRFWGRPVSLRAGVIPPTPLVEARRYPTVYIVPGFGGDDRAAAALVRRRAAVDDASGPASLASDAFLVVLDPVCVNGHSLMADSAVNGPWGRALVEELIPHLESRYPLIDEPEARIVRGHSSGGWSAVWLPLNYPGVFGHGFASSPDPIDFRAFQESTVYGANFYHDESGTLIGSNIRDGQPRTTIRGENLMEEAIAPDNASGQQWDSWLSVFGPRSISGRPADLFDPFSGRINPRIAMFWRAYDIGHQLREDPDRVGPIMRDRIRIIVGGDDQWSLHEAVVLVKRDLAALGFGSVNAPTEDSGFIAIVPGYDHGSIHRAPEMAQFNRALLAAVRSASGVHR